MMLYRPSLSDTTVRIFSISAGLAASTVTPGRTAPEVSLTTPAIPLAAACCADAAAGMRNAAEVFRETRRSAHRMMLRPTPPLVVRTMDVSSCHACGDQERRGARRDLHHSRAA